MTNMSKERNPLSYLDDWGPSKPLDGDSRNNASGADLGAEEAAYGYAAPSVPFNQDVPLNPEWGMLGEGRGGFGHSEDVESKQDYAAWDMDKADVGRGYSKPGSGGAGEPGTASYPQSLPTENPGNPPERYAKEGHMGGETGAHTGRGQPKSTSNPGGETIGSRMNQG
jgi:hypothetical protein